MPSPFPGMNPYFEQPDAWHDFHQAYIAALRISLAPQLSPYYIAKIDENVYLHELSAEQRRLIGKPDVSVLKSSEDSTAFAASTITEQPRVIGRLLPNVDRITESFIEIRDARHRDLITVIDLLSPTNKRMGPDRDQYLSKRGVLISGNVNFVEIDLLRGDPRMPFEGLGECDYCVMVCRSHARPEVGLWPMNLRERLPKIPVPLKQEHPDAALDLQKVLHELYDAARYEDFIYDGSPVPLLSQDDEKWARTILAESERTATL